MTLSQTLALSPGQYVLNFFLGDINGGHASYGLASAVEVLFGGSSLGVFSNAAGGTSTNRMEVLVPFTSNGVNNTLAFSTRDLTLVSYIDGRRRSWQFGNDRVPGLFSRRRAGRAAVT